jgi:hypothetical protein
LRQSALSGRRSSPSAYGANAEQEGLITIGVAAHLCAASPGGPRYNPAQSRDARRAKKNGIWLCQSCGRLVDTDEQKFTVQLLMEWKRGAQDRAFRELVAPSVFVACGEAVRIGSIIEADNRTDGNPDFEQLFAKSQAAAGADLAAYKRAPIWQGGSIELAFEYMATKTPRHSALTSCPWWSKSHQK